MAVALVGGAALGTLFSALYDVVKVAMGRTVNRYKLLLENLKSTLDCFRPETIQKIRDRNMELDLPNEDIERLQQQMEEGRKLIVKLAKPRKWSCDILCSCCKCSNPCHTNQLIELDRSLKALLEVMKVEEARDAKENLLLNRNMCKKQDKLATTESKTLKIVGKNLLLSRKMCKKQNELATMQLETLKITGEILRAQQEAMVVQSEILKIAGEILRAQQEAKGVQELSGSNTQTVVQEQIGCSGVQKAASMFYKRRIRRGCLNKRRRRRGCLNASWDVSSPLRHSMNDCLCVRADSPPSSV